MVYHWGWHRYLPFRLKKLVLALGQTIFQPIRKKGMSQF